MLPSPIFCLLVQPMLLVLSEKICGWVLTHYSMIPTGTVGMDLQYGPSILRLVMECQMGGKFTLVWIH